MKSLGLATIADVANSLLDNHTPTHALFTSYTLDEGELWRLAFDLGLSGRKSLKVRYDPGGFRAWGEVRVVPPSWLLPLQPLRNARRDKPRIPPIYHPKIGLIRSRERSAVILSTGNIAEHDQSRTLNLQCGVRLTPHEASKVISWIRKPEHDRTLCVVVEEGRRARVEIGNQSTWRFFNRYRQAFDVKQEKWELIAPFWSSRALDTVRKGQDIHVKAYFRDAHQAQCVASAIVGPWLNCYAPVRKPPFHHKVIAWRGTKGHRVHSVVYIGSANLTSAGFLGRRDGGAYNWEAGILLIGGKDVWELGRTSVRGTIGKWRRIRIKPGGARVNQEIGADGENDIMDRLRVHLGRVIRTTGRKIRHVAVAPIPDAELQRITLYIDKRRYRLLPGMSRTVSADTKRAFVEGVYRLINKECRAAFLELPQLTCEPAEMRHGSSLQHLGELLRLHIDSNLINKTGDEHNNEDDASTGNGALNDIRFPFQTFLACLAKNRTFALAWLRRVESSSNKDVPRFWRALAKELLERYA